MLNKSKSSLEPMEPARNRIGPTTKIKGDLVSDGNFRIDGLVEGTIITQGRVVVGPTGVITGEVSCKNADVEGSIKGKLKVDELLTLKATAKIHGDIVVDKISIEPGAVFAGTCQMGAMVKDIKHAERKSLVDQKEEKTA
jgi:cytoskeletal protein CcmA (bactofilin family)